MVEPKTMTALMVASMAVSAAGAAMQYSATQKQAKAASEAANRQAQAAYDANSRMMVENNKKAVEAKADRVRQANRELGALRAAQGMGISDTSINALMVETSYAEGLDLSRIENSRKSNQAALLDANKSAQIGALNTYDMAKAKTSGAGTSAVLSFAGDALSIYTSAQKTGPDDTG